MRNLEKSYPSMNTQVLAKHFKGEWVAGMRVFLIGHMNIYIIDRIHLEQIHILKGSEVKVIK